MIDWSFILTLLVILMAALVSSYLRSSRKDRCLQNFDGFDVTVEKVNGRVIWGKMMLTPSGFELVYQSDVQDDRYIETSYILYKEEYVDIQAIYRYAYNLSEENRLRRNQDMERSFHPNQLRRLGRAARNFLNTATESLNDVVSLMVGRVRKPAAHLISETREAYLADIGKNIVGYVGSGHDPLLERYVGTRIVMEVVENEEIHEHVGVMKEYSADFLEVLDVFYPLPQQVRLAGEGSCDVMDQVKVTADGRQVLIQNTGDPPALIERVCFGNEERELNAIVGGGEEITLHLNDIGGDIVLHLRIACLLDMIVPRKHSLIRHRAERYGVDTIFDIGLSLVRREVDDKEIERLRQSLRYTPNDAISAAKLGELLFKHGDLAEAHHWLSHAQAYCRQLPDNGNRVALNLRLLERRLDDMRSPSPPTAPARLAAPGNGQDPHQ